MKPLAIAVSAVMAALGATMAASAMAETLEEVIVTAGFRDTSLMDSSHSASVLGPDVVRRRAAQHLEDVLNAAPNVNFAGGTSRARYFQLRGVGDRSQFQEPLNPSVGLLIDGVDFSGIGTVGTLFDIEQVEILRGPQGTLHGANALGGLINIRSNPPQAEPHAHIEAGLGNYDTWNLGLVAGGPASERWLYRVAVQQYRGDGYQDNAFTGEEDTNGRDELTLRGRLRWLASEHHTVDLGLTWVDVDNGYDAFSLDNTRTTLSDEPGRDEQESAAFNLHVQSILDRVEMQSRLAYASTDSDYGYDEDWTWDGFHPDGYSSYDLYSRQRDSISAGLRFLSTESSRLLDGRTGWVAGIYYLDNREDLDRTYTYAPFFGSEYDTAAIALYTEWDTALGQGLTLVTGLRWEQRDTDYEDNNGVAFGTDEDLWGGRLALEYQWSEYTALYGSVSRGYRANGINASILASVNATEDPDDKARLGQVGEFDGETLHNYELGLKSSLLEDRLRTRLAVFYMDREDQQVRGSFLVARESGATTFIDYTSNAAEGRNLGAELEVDWLASESLRLWAALGLLRTRFDEYVNISGEDLEGRDQAHAPRHQYSLGARYDFPAGVFLGIELEGKDRFYFSDRHDLEADSSRLLNAHIGIERGPWRLMLWGRNLGDEDYQVRGFGSFGNDPRKGYVTEPYFQFGEPRVWGGTASLSF